MIGPIIRNIRMSKKINLTQLAKLSEIDKGHLSHIENGLRRPSPTVLKRICNALEIPYQQLLYSYDKTMNSNQVAYGIVNHIPYNKVPATDNLCLIDIPVAVPSAAIAIKLLDDSMSPTFKKGSYVYVEFNSPLNNNDVGVFSLNNTILIRRFILDNEDILLRPDNLRYKKFCVKNEDSNFYIIGKVLNV